jgi:hypothetical protein
MKEALSSPEKSIHTRAIRRYIPEDASLHSHRRENLKPYLGIDVWGCIHHGKLSSCPDRETQKVGTK